jgi:hypothetical protein
VKITRNQPTTSTQLGDGLSFRCVAKKNRVSVNGAIHRWDAATGNALTPEAAWNSVVEQILVTPECARVNHARPKRPGLGMQKKGSVEGADSCEISNIKSG